MKTSTKEIKENKKVESEVSKLTEAFALWLNTSKAGTKYLSGLLNDKLGSGKVVGFYNSNKKNPKEPDIRVYSVDSEGNQDREIADLWDSVSKNENEYLTGISDEKERLIGFYNAEESESKKPYIKVYFKN